MTAATKMRPSGVSDSDSPSLGCTSTAAPPAANDDDRPFVDELRVRFGGSTSTCMRSYTVSNSSVAFVCWRDRISAMRRCASASAMDVTGARPCVCVVPEPATLLAALDRAACCAEEPMGPALDDRTRLSLSLSCCCCCCNARSTFSRPRGSGRFGDTGVDDADTLDAPDLALTVDMRRRGAALADATDVGPTLEGRVVVDGEPWAVTVRPRCVAPSRDGDDGSDFAGEEGTEDVDDDGSSVAAKFLRVGDDIFGGGSGAPFLPGVPGDWAVDVLRAVADMELERATGGGGGGAAPGAAADNDDDDDDCVAGAAGAPKPRPTPPLPLISAVVDVTVGPADDTAEAREGMAAAGYNPPLGEPPAGAAVPTPLPPPAPVGTGVPRPAATPAEEAAPGPRTAVTPFGS